MSKDYLWTEKWRPNKVEDCILPENIKKTLLGFVEQESIPNMLLSGPPGVGKTTVAKALCNQLGMDFIVINGSDEGRFLDTVRNQAKNFASTISLGSGGKPKAIIIDEADNTTNDVQLLLRASIENFHSTCRFIFTCNYVNKIIEPLHSRCTHLNFSPPSTEAVNMATSFMARVENILKAENVEYSPKVIAALFEKHYPDWRRILNELQRYSSSNGLIDIGILASEIDSVPELILALKNKNFADVRKWVVSNQNGDFHRTIRIVYDALYSKMDPQSIPAAVLVFAKYDYQANFAVDKEIHLLACFTELMCDCKFK
jgi:DNA polymerase III delta prime subunit